MLFRAFFVALPFLTTHTLAAPALKGPENLLYFPITVGAKWVYDCPNDVVETCEVATVEKDGDNLIVSRQGLDGTRTNYAKMIVTPEGLRQERELTDGKIGWVLKTKLIAGSSWDMPEGSKRTVHGPEEITVPAGKFKALRVVWEQGGATCTSWYAPGVGEIKRIETRGDTVTIKRVLKSFNAKKS